MKIFASFSTDKQERVRIVWPDSCWLLSDRPLYIPDFDPEFNALPMAAYRIDRLGKHIAPRFAHRYISNFSAGVVVMPEKALQALLSGFPVDAMNYCFDNSIVIGNWQQTPVEEVVCKVMFPYSSSHEESFQSAYPNIENVFYALSDFSRFNTIKMGDVMLLPLSIPAIKLKDNLQLIINTPDSNELPLVNTRFK